MILLDRNDYAQAFEFLGKVNFNTLFAGAVIEGCVSGAVYADSKVNPKTFYILHSYGMSLLIGDCSNEKFNSWFYDYSLNVNKVRNSYEWMQVYPNEWNSVLHDLYGEKLITSAENTESLEKGMVELNTRINFKFNLEKYLEVIQRLNSKELEIVRSDKDVFYKMKGSVVPSYFWDNADDFNGNGVAFCLYCNNKLATTAFSSYITDTQLELGMETKEEFRGKGFAQKTCAAFIDYCIENNYEPVWACRLENQGSYNLALKLGFEPVLELPYYRLGK